METQFESEAHRPKAKRQKVAESSKQTTIGSWIYGLGQTVLQTASSVLQTDAESHSQSSSRRATKPRGNNQKTTAPLLVNKNFKEERQTLMPQLPHHLKLDVHHQESSSQVCGKPRGKQLCLDEESAAITEFEDDILHQNFINHPNATDVLELTKQSVPEDAPVDERVIPFPMYNDSELKFLDPNTKIGRQIGKSIVEAEFDDDCNTDEEMQMNASRLL